MLKSREILYEALTKDFSRPSPDMAMLFGPFGCTHPPSPCPTVSVHTQPTYLPTTLPDDIMKLKVSWHIHVSLVGKRLTNFPLRTVSNSIYAKKDRNGPPNANQVVSTAEPRLSHAVCTLQVHPSTSPSLKDIAKSYIKKQSLMTDIYTRGPKDSVCICSSVALAAIQGTKWCHPLNIKTPCRFHSPFHWLETPWRLCSIMFPSPVCMRSS